MYILQEFINSLPLIRLITVVDVNIYDTIPNLPSHILSYANMPYQILSYADWNIYDW